MYVTHILGSLIRDNLPNESEDAVQMMTDCVKQSLVNHANKRSGNSASKSIL